MSIALVLRLFWVESLEKIASRNLALASGPVGVGAGLAGHVVGLRDLELPAVGGGLEALGLLIDHVVEIDRGLREQLLRLLVAELALDLGAHRLVALLLAAANGRELDHVVAEVALDHAADLARLQAVGRVLERLDHGAAAEEVEVAALLRRALVLGVLLRDLGELRGILLHLGEDRLGLGLGLLPLGLGRVLVGLDQDVAGAALLRRGEALLVLGVVLAKLVLGDGDVLLQRIEVEHEVLDRGLLGSAELRRMRRILVVGLDLGIGRRHLGQIVLGVEALHLDLALLVHRVERRRGRRGRRGGRAGDALQHLPGRDVLAQPLREHLRRHPEGRQDGRIDEAVGIAQLRELRVVLEQRAHPLVGRREVELVGRGGEDALADQGVERHAPHLRRLEQLGIDSGHLPARPLDPLAQGVVELDLADLVAVDRGHRLLVAALHAAVALDAEEHERRKHQQHEHELQDAGVTAEEIEHGRVQMRERRTVVRLSWEDGSDSSRSQAPGTDRRRGCGWWVLRGSNPRPTPCKGAALPAELSTRRRREPAAEFS